MSNDLSFDEQVALLTLLGWEVQRRVPLLYPAIVHPARCVKALARRTSWGLEVHIVRDGVKSPRIPEQWSAVEAPYVWLTLEAVLEELNHG